MRRDVDRGRGSELRTGGGGFAVKIRIVFLYHCFIVSRHENRLEYIPVAYIIEWSTGSRTVYLSLKYRCVGETCLFRHISTI